MWNARAARATRALNKAQATSSNKRTKRQVKLIEDTSTSFVSSKTFTPRAETFIPSHGVK